MDAPRTRHRFADSIQRRRAAGLYAWTEPLRQIRRRQQRLARACGRAAVLALATGVVWLIAGAQHGYTGWRLGLGAVLLCLSSGLGVVGLRALRDAEATAREIDEREAEAVRALDAAS